ncbi:MAG: hypothetical protein AAF431_19765 [Pseudomonadota bacterium]
MRENRERESEQVREKHPAAIERDDIAKEFASITPKEYRTTVRAKLFSSQP